MLKQKPMTLQEIVNHNDRIYIEFRLDIRPYIFEQIGVLSALLFVNKVRKHYGFSRMELMKDYRFWRLEPTDEERAEKWEE